MGNVCMNSISNIILFKTATRCNMGRLRAYLLMYVLPGTLNSRTSSTEGSRVVWR